MRQRLVQLLPRLSGLASAGSSGARVAPVACQLLNARSFADEASLLKTPLYDFHVEHGGACPSLALSFSRRCTYVRDLHSGPLHAHKTLVFRTALAKQGGACLMKLLLCRQDGAVCGLVDAHPVQGLPRGGHAALQVQRVSI